MMSVLIAMILLLVAAWFFAKPRETSSRHEGHSPDRGRVDHPAR